MLKYSILLTLFLSTKLFGQNVSDSLLATFYNRTLQYYFSKAKVNEDQAKFGKILIQTKFDTSRLIKNSGKNVFVFFDSTVNKHSLLDKPFKNNINRSIYWIDHIIQSLDSVDINVGAWNIDNISEKNISLYAGCQGTFGYIPNGRFVYSKNTNTWKFVCRGEIYKKIIGGK